MAERTLVIHLQLGEPITGVWCDTCLLPAAGRWPVYGISDYGVSLVGNVEACPECRRADEVACEFLERYR